MECSICSLEDVEMTRSERGVLWRTHHFNTLRSTFELASQLRLVTWKGQEGVSLGTRAKAPLANGGQLLAKHDSSVSRSYKYYLVPRLPAQNFAHSPFAYSGCTPDTRTYHHAENEAKMARHFTTVSTGRIFIAASALMALLFYYLLIEGYQRLQPARWTDFSLANASHADCAWSRGNARANLLLAALSSDSYHDQVFRFMESLERAVSHDTLRAVRGGSCPPPPIHVRILCPASVALNPSPSFKAIMRRYPTLKFVGLLPDLPDVPIVYSRFVGWSQYVHQVQAQYDKILSIDIDVVFQRDPFRMPMRPGVDLLMFSEWRGLTIGQCRYHEDWFAGCKSSGTITEEDHASYRDLDRICAGSTYGTAVAMSVYLETMRTMLEESQWRCNDQALHIHMFYSGILNERLANTGLGEAFSIPESESLLGTVGTTPLVRFNEWGEILNEQGHVQHIIHQYKHHWLLTELVDRKYSWLADPGLEGIATAHQLIPEAQADYENPSENIRYRLAGVTGETCGTFSILCSCRESDCQFRY